MANVIQNTISFNDVNVASFTKSGTFGRSQIFENCGDGKLPVKPFVNAVEKDWNGAQLGNNQSIKVGESTLFD